MARYRAEGRRFFTRRSAAARIHVKQHISHHAETRISPMISRIIDAEPMTAGAARRAMRAGRHRREERAELPIRP